MLKVDDLTDVRALFDGITYHKGAGVLHMQLEYLGKDVFFARIRKYLARYKFGNADTEQLSDELGGAKVVAMMMDVEHDEAQPAVAHGGGLAAVRGRHLVRVVQARSRHLQALRVEFLELARDLVQPVWRRIGGFCDGNNAHEHDTEVMILRPLLLSARVRFDDADMIAQGYEILEDLRRCLVATAS